MKAKTSSTVDHNSEQRKGSRLRQYMAASAMNLAAFANGVVVGWPSPTLPQLLSDDNPAGAGPMTEDAASWLGSLMCIGSLLAAPAYGHFCSRCSRKNTGYMIALQGVVGWGLISLASSEIMLFVGRFILGVAGAGATMLCPQYVAETADAEVRGTLCSFVGLFGNCGVLFAYTLGSALPYQQFCLGCLATYLVFALAFVWAPESPVYLAAKGRHPDAVLALRWLRVSGGLPTSGRTPGPDGRPSFKDVLRQPATRRGLLVGTGLMVNNQFSGILAVVSYTVTIFEESGSKLSPNLSTILVGVLQLFGVYLTSYFVDRTGRRVLLVTSNVIAAVSLAILGAYFHLKNQCFDLTSLGWVPLACLCVYVVGVALGIGCVPFVMISEIFPPEVRGFCTAVCICCLNGLAFLVARFFLAMSQALGMDGCYWLFATCCAASAFFCRYVVPETKNKSLAAIVQELNGQGGSVKLKEKLGQV